MKKIIYRRLHDLFGDEIPKEIRRRVENELKMMYEFNMEGQVALLYDLVKDLRSKDIPYVACGETANSYLLYLLNLTHVNPLKPHHYCSECRRIYFTNDNLIDGFDMDRKTCPSCGAEMLPDGHNLCSEIFWGVDSKGTSVSDPIISIKVPESCFGRVRMFIKNDRRSMYGSYVKPDNIGFYSGNIRVMGAMSLPDKIEGSTDEVLAEEVSNFTLENYFEILNLTRETVPVPKSFTGVLKMYGLTRGSWARINNQRSDEADGGLGETVYSLDDFGYSLDVVPAFYDDVYSMLLDEDIDSSKAFVEAWHVHLGRGLSEELVEAMYENNSLPWCNRTIRLLAKGHGVEYLTMAYVIAKGLKLEEDPAEKSIIRVVSDPEDVEVEVDQNIETEAETEPEAEVDKDIEPEVETESEPEVDKDIEIETETESEPEVDKDIEPESETEPEPEVDKDIEIETELDQDIEIETETEVDREVNDDIIYKTEKEIMKKFHENRLGK